MIFGLIWYEEMQVKFEYECNPTIIDGVIALGLRKLIENDSFRSFVHEYWMDSKDVWYADVS
jgi:hypothetical protein